MDGWNIPSENVDIHVQMSRRVSLAYSIDFVLFSLSLLFDFVFFVSCSHLCSALLEATCRVTVLA